MSKPSIGFCGMTHLGLVSAVAVAEKGFPVVCFDPKPQVIKELSKGKLPVREPDLDDLLASNKDHIGFFADAGVLSGCDVVTIAADVPTDDKGESDLSPIRTLIDAVSPHLNDNGILVVLCQVPPGFTRGLDFPKDRLFYQVETLIFGRAVDRALNPERFIVGCDGPEKPLPDAYEAVLGAFGCPILPMRYESAELAKIAINCCLVASISTANTLAELCEKLGADWSEIVPALKLDKRIGPDSYLTPGLGLAGGNLERDLATVLRLAEEHGTDGGVVRSWVDNSARRKEWAAGVLKEEVINNNPDAKIAVWGLAYKENTHSTRNSPALALLTQIDSHNFIVFDPVVPAEAAGDKATGAADAIAAATGADVLLVMTPWPEFKEISPKKIAAALQGKTVIDPYGVLDGKASQDAGLDYFTLGRPPLKGRA